MNEKEIHLRDYFRIILKRRKSAFAFLLFTITVVLIVTLTGTPIYEASTQILVEKNESAPLLGGRYYGSYDPEFYRSQTEIINSLNVARRVVRILSLEQTYNTYFPGKNDGMSFIKSILDWPRELFAGGHQKTEKKKSKTDIIAEIIKKNISVDLVKHSKLLNISYQSENPKFAELVANSTATAYIEELMAIQLNASGYAIRWMTQKAEEEKVKLANSEKALQDFMREQDIVTIEDRITIIPQKLSGYTAQLAAAESERKELELIYRQIEKLQKEGGDLETIPALTADTSLQSLRSQIRDIEKQIHELSQNYGEKHPTMKKARGDLQILKQKTKQEIDKFIKSIKNKYELAKSKENEIHNTLADAKKEAQTLNEKFVQYGILKREVETNQALYKALNMRIKENDATEETQNVNVWITEVAETPERPVKPNKRLNIMLGILFGVCGGIGLTFFLEYLDNTINAADEAESKLGLSTLGVIPDFKPEWGKNIELALYQDPFSPFSEGFKSLRSSILLSAADAPPKSILVTSISPGEGKTTTSINLAIAIAQTDKKVLIIDSDMRKPRIHKIFNIANSKGLSSYLAGIENNVCIYPVADCLGKSITNNVVQKVSESELNIIPSGATTQVHIVPSGPLPPNPSELLVSNRLVVLLEKLRKEFDFIIIDSPPVLQATDGLIVSKAVEGTVLVTRASKTTYELVKQGLKALTEINAPILGMVINGMDIDDSKYYYSYGYYQQNSDKKVKRRNG